MTKTKGQPLPDDLRQLSVAEVAEIAKVKPSTIASYRHRGQMPPADGKIGNSWWWWSTTIDRWLQERQGQGWRRGKFGPHDKK